MPPKKSKPVVLEGSGSAVVMDENTPTLLEQLQGKVNQLEAAVNAEMSKPPSPPKEHTLETALKEKLGAAEALIVSLRKEVERLNGRLSSEGGSARLPPALITTSTLYTALEASLGESQGQCAALTAQLGSLAAASSTHLATLRALTAMEVTPTPGQGAGVVGLGGALSGRFTCTTSEPLSGKVCTFQLDFYTSTEDGSSLVEYSPGLNASSLLPTFLHTPITFSLDQLPMFNCKVCEALRSMTQKEGEEEQDEEKEGGESGNGSGSGSGSGGGGGSGGDGIEGGADEMMAGSGSSSSSSSSASPPLPSIGGGVGGGYVLQLGGKEVSFSSATPMAAKRMEGGGMMGGAGGLTHTASKTGGGIAGGVRAPHPSLCKSHPALSSRRRERTPGAAASVSPLGLLFVQGGGGGRGEGEAPAPAPVPVPAAPAAVGGMEQ